MSGWWPSSVRRSTALSAALLCAVVFTLGWLGTRELLSRQLAGTAVNTTRVQLDRLADGYLIGRPAPPTGDALFEVVDESGRPVASSENLRRWDPAWTPLPPAPAGAPADWTVTTKATLKPGDHPQWREYREYTVVGKVIDSGGQRLTVYLFVLPWDTLRTLGTFDDTLRFFVPLAVLVTALAAWLAAGRALRPVEAIRRELAEVSGSRLDRRVPVPPSRDEIARLATTTNATLDRLQQAYEQQERFVADASHELRSPLAGLRAGLEVALTHTERADWPAVARRSLLDVQRLQRITADLLQLAGDPAGFPEGVVDLADVVGEQVAERALDPGPEVVSDVDGPVPVSGEPVQLERLLRNLLDNAVRHARSSVTVRLRREAGEAILEVSDDGPGIPPADRERVFDRFARLDDARARDAGGTGLGLTLARDIVVRHGGSLRAEDGAPGARLVARLPLRGM
ncbi:sensor histidine kinase [Amycolatopsis decaplanina]|uniref:histidine kinase n=1 Tax=Amycolatopsis decaplanina DSM 44594 TaxID=1284240 RepID=M2XMS5_9PSEU|nr:ATP-binding protein [Amycolatopsis decaplanina]EME50460.1 putative two-component system sensor kinase [Amycolatopsis decaplanina DSM 44594]